MSAPEPLPAHFHANTPVSGEPKIQQVRVDGPLVVVVRFGADVWSPDIALRDAGQARALAAAFTRAALLLEAAGEAQGPVPAA